MGIRKILREIANQVDVDNISGCPSVVDVVDQLAAERGIYTGRRIVVKPKEEEEKKGVRVEILRDGEVQTTNFQEAWWINYEGDEYIVDPYFPKKVYTPKQYKKCFFNPEELGLYWVDEP